MPFVPDNQPVRKSGFVPDERSIGGFVGNVAKSAGRLVGDTASAITNPIDTVKGILSTVQNPQILIDYYRQRYGKDLAKTLYEDPVGVAADLSTILTGGGGLATKIGTAGKLGTVAKVGSGLSKAGRMIDPLSVAGRVVKPASSKLFSRVGAGLEKAGDDVLVKGLGSTKKLDDLSARAGTTKNALIEKYNLYDRDPFSARSAGKSAVERANDLTIGKGKPVPASLFIQSIDDEIANLGDLPEASRSDATVNRIVQLQKNKQAVMALADENGNITPERMIRYRKELDEVIPNSMFGLDPRGSGAAKANKATRDVFRKKINSFDPEIAQSNLDYGALKEMGQAFTRYQSRTKGKSPISFSGVTKAGVGGYLAGVPGAMAGYAADIIASDPRFLKASSKVLKGTGQTMQKAKAPKIPMGDKIYSTTRATRLLNPSNLSRSQDKQQRGQGGSSQAPPPLKPVKEVSETTYASVTPSKVKRTRIAKGNPFSKVKTVKAGSFN